jgi:hypothetical protein
VSPPPPDYATVVIESGPAGPPAADSLYSEPADALSFELVARPTAAHEDAFSLPSLPLRGDPMNEFLAPTATQQYSPLPALQRRSLRRSGHFVALGIETGLQRADSEAQLVEAAEPINVDEVVDLDDDEESEDGFGPAEYVEPGAEAEREEVEEAVNLPVILARGGRGRGITISIDTSSSVI